MVGKGNGAEHPGPETPESETPESETQDVSQDVRIGNPKWPLGLWALQAGPAAFLLWFGLWRLSRAEQIVSSQTTTILILVAGGGWMALALVPLLTGRGRRWLIAHRKEWGLSAASLLCGLVLLDIALTLFGIVPTVAQQRAQSIVYSAGHFTRHRLIPQALSLPDGSTLQINRRGFRGAEIAAADPGARPEVRSGARPEVRPGVRPGARPGTRIVFLGGSQVFDFNGGDWPARVGALLRHRGHAVETINAGVPGHDTADSLGKLMTDLWVLGPDIVVLCQAWNDIKYFAALAPDRPYRGQPPLRAQSWLTDWRLHPRGLDRVLSASALYRSFRWGLGTLLYNQEGRERAAVSPVAVAARRISDWGPKQYRLNLQLIAALNRHIGSELVLCKQARLAVVDGAGTDREGPDQAAARDYGTRMLGLPHGEVARAFAAADRAVDAVAREHDLLVVDMNAALSGRAAHFADGIHFNEAGSQAAAVLVADALAPLLAGRAR